MKGILLDKELLYTIQGKELKYLHLIDCLENSTIIENLSKVETIHIIMKEKFCSIIRPPKNTKRLIIHYGDFGKVPMPSRSRIILPDSHSLIYL